MPSHILVPAIHKNRDADPRPVPPHAARCPAGSLRRSARAGRGRPRAPAPAVPRGEGRRSAAPTSPSPRPASVAVVESEGNGRMCTTLPEVLISVMGIEKVIPTWQDLEVYLQLLPRSSTAERMNPYTSVWTGVSDGRRAARVPSRARRPRPHQRARRRDRPPGTELHPLLGLPERLPGLRAHRRPRLRRHLSRPDRRDPHADARRASTRPARCPYASSLCGACYEVCPVKINIPEVLVHLRGEVVRHQGATAPSTSRCARSRACSPVAGSTRPRSAPAGSGSGRSCAAGKIERLPGPLAGWTAARDLQSRPAPELPRLVARA